MLLEYQKTYHTPGVSEEATGIFIDTLKSIETHNMINTPHQKGAIAPQTSLFCNGSLIDLCNNYKPVFSAMYFLALIAYSSGLAIAGSCSASTRSSASTRDRTAGPVWPTRWSPWDWSGRCRWETTRVAPSEPGPGTPKGRSRTEPPLAVDRCAQDRAAA